MANRQENDKSSVASASTNVTAYLPRISNGQAVLQQAGKGLWKIVHTKGVAYRRTKNMDDRVLNLRGPEHGQVLEGVDDGGGWICCSIEVSPDMQSQFPSTAAPSTTSNLMDTFPANPGVMFNPIDLLKAFVGNQSGLELMQVTLTTTREGSEKWSMEVEVLSNTKAKALRQLLRRPPYSVLLNQSHLFLFRLSDAEQNHRYKGMLATLKDHERVTPHIVIKDFSPSQIYSPDQNYEEIKRTQKAFLQDLWTAYNRMGPKERRARSWVASVSVASVVFEATGTTRARFYTSAKPYVIWIVEATEKVEGVLLDEGYFDGLGQAGAFRSTDCFIMGHDLEASEKEYFPFPEFRELRIRVKKLRYDDIDAISSVSKPDLIMLYHAEFMSTLGDGGKHIKVPTHVIDAGKGAPVAVTMRFKLWEGSVNKLSSALGEELIIPPLRNLFSALAGDNNVEYDDNGWLVGLARVEALNKFLKMDLRPPFPEVRDPENKLIATFWGIVDLKYNPLLSIFERVKVLETGDGRNSKFSHHGAEIPKRFRARHCLTDRAGNGRHTVVSNNKKLTHDEFVSNGYGYVVPQQLCLPRVYDSTLAQRIKDGLGCSQTDILVLKLCNRARAAGIIPVPVHELDEVLEELLEVPVDLEAWFERKKAQGNRQFLGVQWGAFEEQYRHWWCNECPFFAVERCYGSLPTPSEEDEHLYDGTLRVAFALRRKASQRADSKTKPEHITDIDLDDKMPSPEQKARGELEIEWLGGYWKLPKEGVGSPHLRDRIISAAKTKGTQSVSLAHLHEIYAALGRSIQILFSAAAPSITSLSQGYDDEPVMAAYFTARLAVTLRDPDRGRQTLELAESLLLNVEDGFPKRCVQSYIQRGYGVFEAQSWPGCWKEALHRFSLSLISLPSNANAWYLKGMALLELGRPEESIEPMKRALLLDLDFKAPYVNIGIAWLRLGNYDAVIEISEALLLRHPDSPQCNYHIGLSCFAKAQEVHMHADGSAEELSHEEVTSYETLRARSLQQMTLARESAEGQRLETRAPPVSPWLVEDGEIMRMLQPEHSMTATKSIGAASDWCKITLPHNVGWRVMGWRT